MQCHSAARPALGDERTTPHLDFRHQFHRGVVGSWRRKDDEETDGGETEKKFDGMNRMNRIRDRNRKTRDGVEQR